MRARKDEVLPDFVPAVQNSFAARMAWSVTPDFKSANHEPQVSGPLSISGKPGQTLKLKVKCKDPDGDEINGSWAQYKVGSYQGDVTVTDNTVTVPEDAVSGDTIHLVLTVADIGTPQLTTYLRTIITVL